jgi:hypothetical protein
MGKPQSCPDMTDGIYAHGRPTAPQKELFSIGLKRAFASGEKQKSLSKTPVGKSVQSTTLETELRISGIASFTDDEKSIRGTSIKRAVVGTIYFIKS